MDEEEEAWVARWGESLFDTHVRHALEPGVGVGVGVGVG